MVACDVTLPVLTGCITQGLDGDITRTGRLNLSGWADITERRNIPQRGTSEKQRREKPTGCVTLSC